VSSDRDSAVTPGAAGQRRPRRPGDRRRCPHCGQSSRTMPQRTLSGWAVQTPATSGPS